MCLRKLSHIEGAGVPARCAVRDLPSGREEPAQALGAEPSGRKLVLSAAPHRPTEGPFVIRAHLPCACCRAGPLWLLNPVFFCFQEPIKKARLGHAAVWGLFGGSPPGPGVEPL